MKILKRSNGLYYAEIMRKGKRYYFTSKNKKEVENKIIEFNYNYSKGINVNDDNNSVESFSYFWLKTYKSDIEKATYNMYESCIRLYINKYIGKIRLKQLKESDIMYMLNAMSEKGITRRKDVTLMTLKQILNKAVDNDLIYKNVANSIKIKKHTAPEKKHLSDDTIALIEENKNKYTYLLLTHFMIYTGLRREEIIPLRYEDIDFENKKINITKAVHFENNQPRLKSTKNTEHRWIPLLQNIDLDKNRKGYIFPNTKNKMMSETTFKRQIEYANKFVKNNIENYERFTAHILRHTYACILHKADISLKEAQFFMGHKDIKVLLQIYTHLDESDKLKAQNKLDSFVNFSS